MSPPGNLILRTDSYKFTHWKQYPPGTERVYSYFESRGGKWHDVVFFGLQYYLKKFLEGNVISQHAIDEAEQMVARHFGDSSLFNRRGWEHILRAHGGCLPVTIRAVPEGTPVPVHNVLMTIENTDPACYWLPNYLETLLVQVWYGSTVATQSREMRNLVLKYLHRTGDPSLIDFKVHDFGFRGVSSVETAGVGAAAHLLSFRGTDTFEGIMVARDYYGEPMAGVSIPAAEHSTITAWGKAHEVDAMRNMLDSILYAMQKAGFSADNIAFGSGGGLLQKLNRDILKFAFKCAAVTINGVEHDVYKNPVTDHGKRSKSGRMKLVKVEGPRGTAYRTVKWQEPGEDQLVEVFRDGKIMRQWQFSEVRQRAGTWI